MKHNKVGQALKEIRGDKTQQQFAFDMGVVRETISKYENGRAPIPQDISKKSSPNMTIQSSL